MKNFIQEGRIVTATMPYDRNSGEFVLIGTSLGGVCQNTVLSGGSNQIVRVGMFSGLAKATGEAWTIGNDLYWDNTNKRFTTTSAGNTKAGVAMNAAASGDTTGNVLLPGKLL